MLFGIRLRAELPPNEPLLFLLANRGLIEVERSLGIAIILDAPVIDPNHAIANLCSRVDVMTDQQKRRRILLNQLLQSREAFILEVGIANAEHFVDNEHLRCNRGRCRKNQAHRHTGRIDFQRLIDVLLEFRECDDVTDELIGFRS